MLFHSVDSVIESSGCDYQSSIKVIQFAPVAPFGIKGVIWYQGEANVSRAQGYHKLSGALITNWRGVWGQQDLPFYYVKLANYIPNRSDSLEDTWAVLREAQWQTLSLPKTGMAVTIDIGDPQDFHPKNKQKVGHRLALWVLVNSYGRKRVFGPAVRNDEDRRG